MRTSEQCDAPAMHTEDFVQITKKITMKRKWSLAEEERMKNSWNEGSTTAIKWITKSHTQGFFWEIQEREIWFYFLNWNNLTRKVDFAFANLIFKSQFLA